jgi:hypothetical protein
MTKQNWKRTKYFSKYEWVTQQVTKSRKDITRVRISEHQQIIQNKTQKGKVKEKKKISHSWVPVTHAYCPSYLGG